MKKKKNTKNSAKLHLSLALLVTMLFWLGLPLIAIEDERSLERLYEENGKVSLPKGALDLEPVELGQFDSQGAMQEVVVDDIYAYTASASLGLEIFDISDPTSPKKIGGYIIRSSYKI